MPYQKARSQLQSSRFSTQNEIIRTLHNEKCNNKVSIFYIGGQMRLHVTNVSDLCNRNTIILCSERIPTLDRRDNSIRIAYIRFKLRARKVADFGGQLITLLGGVFVKFSIKMSFVRNLDVRDIMEMILRQNENRFGVHQVERKAEQRANDYSRRLRFGKRPDSSVLPVRMISSFAVLILF